MQPPLQAPAAAPLPRRRGRFRRLLRKALLAIALIMVLNEIRVYVIAAALAPNVPQEASGLIQMWGQYASLNDSSSLNLGAAPLRRALTRQTRELAERTFERYRTANATIFEREWRQTRDAVALALIATPSSQRLEAALRYCEGHLRRIDGEARIKAKQSAAGVQELTAAVSAFRRAAELRTEWPDPFLGLMRTFIGMEDVERGADALAQAQRFGYVAGNRDWALLGEGYLARAAKLAASEEVEPLNRAVDAYTQAIEHLNKAVPYGNVAQRLRETRRRLAEVQQRIQLLTDPVDRESAVLSGVPRLPFAP